MGNRRWTVMVIPHGSDSPRSLSVSERGLRVAASVGAAVALVALMGVGYAIAGFSRALAPAPLAAQQADSSAALRAIARGVENLRDTLALIREREEQIRLLAGLPSSDSVMRTSAIGSLASGEVITSAGIAATPTGEIAENVDSLLARARFLSTRFEAVSDSLSRNKRRFESLPSIMPTAGWLTSHFSRARVHPLLRGTRRHEGIDVSAPMGSPIVAPAAGVVKRVTRQSGYGLMVEIDHGNGMVTRYAHCSRADVRAGQRVRRGDQIAAVGNSGLATGPHLHYEIIINGKAVDPLTYVLPDVIPD